MAASVPLAERLGLEFISGLGLHPARFVELAARLGLGRIGLAPKPIVSAPDASPWDLLSDPALAAEVKRAMAETGVRLALGEGLLIMPGLEIADAASLLDLMADLGAPVVNAVVVEPDAARANDQFALLVAMAAERDLSTSVEFMPGMPVGTLAQALALAEASGSPSMNSTRAGVLVDAMHLFASGGTPEDLRAADPDRILYAQICDSRLPGFYEGYYEDARCNRVLPGQGMLPLAEFVAALPADCAVGLELPLLARAQAGEDIEALLAQALATCRALPQT